MLDIHIACRLGRTGLEDESGGACPDAIPAIGQLGEPGLAEALRLGCRCLQEEAHSPPLRDPHWVTPLVFLTLPE